jgi:fibronectin type 3 domain-containing protein
MQSQTAWGKSPHLSRSSHRRAVPATLLVIFLLSIAIPSVQAAPVPPSAPRELSATPIATGVATGVISLAWYPPTSEGSSTVHSYLLYRGMTPGNFSALAQGSCGGPFGYWATSCTDSGVVTGQTYYYKISAISGAGESPLSNQASAVARGWPQAPVGLTIEYGNAKATLSWNPPFNDGGSPITAYRVYRGGSLLTTGGCSSLSNVITCVDTGLTNEASYGYTVKAVSAAGEGAASGTAYAWPSAEEDGVVAMLQPTAGQSIQFGSGTTPMSIGCSASRTPQVDPAFGLAGMQFAVRPVNTGQYNFGQAVDADVPYAATRTMSDWGISETGYYEARCRIYEGGAYHRATKTFALTPSSTPSVSKTTWTPGCTQGVGFVDSCIGESYGFTNAISGGGLPEFTINWGLFGNHNKVACQPVACTFFMKFGLTLTSPSPLPFSYHDQTVTAAHLQRQDSTGTWIPAGELNVTLRSTNGGENWQLSLPDLTLPATQIHPDDASATKFRLVPQPLGSGPNWILALQTAQAELVAPPVVLVGGWATNPFDYDFVGNAPSPYLDASSSVALDRANVVNLYGQDPWSWSGGHAVRKAWLDGKADIRISSMLLLGEIVRAKDHPHVHTNDYNRVVELQTSGPNATMHYTGRVDLIAFSMGGLISRYLLEAGIDDLDAWFNNKGTFTTHVDREFGYMMDAAIDANWHGRPASTLVSKLVMIDTPHLGSFEATVYTWLLASPYYIHHDGRPVYSEPQNPLRAPGPWYADGAYRNQLVNVGPSLLADFELQADLDLLLVNNPFIDYLDSRYGEANVPYFLMAGAQTWDGQGPLHARSRSDTIVSVHSQTHGLDGCYRIFQDRNPNGLNYVASAFHNDMPSHAIVQRHAVAFLAGNPTGLCQGSNAYASIEAEQAPNAFASIESENAAAGDALILIAELRPADPNSYKFEWNNPVSCETTIDLLSWGGEVEDVGLRDPDGTIALYSNGNTSAVTWEHVATSQPSHQIMRITISMAAPGTWTLSSNHSVGSETFVVPLVTCHTSLRMSVSSPPSTLANTAYHLEVSLAEGSIAITHATMTMSVLLADNSTMNLALGDDGQASDAVPDDGIYSLTSTFAVPGTYPYVLTADFNGTHLKAKGTISVLAAPRAMFGVPASPVRNLVADPGPSARQVTLSWDPPASDGGSPVTRYEIFRNTTGGYVFLSTSPSGAYVDSALADNITYDYRVVAVNGPGTSDPSPTATATTFAKPGKPVVAAGAGPGAGQATITWTPPAYFGGTSVTGYQIYRAPGTGSLALIGQAPATASSFVESGLLAGTQYRYAIAAVNVVGEGLRSPDAQVVTMNIPSKPLGLSATGDVSEVHLAWQPPSTNGGSVITGYRIYRGTTTTTALVATLGNVLTYDDEGLTNGQTYYYQVRAINAVGQSAKSDLSSAIPATVPNAPAGLAAAPGVGKVDLTWTAPAFNGGRPISNYNVYRGTTHSNGVLVATIGNVAAYTDAGLTNGQTYYYAVQAVNSVGAGAFSTQTTAIPATVPDAPTGLGATAGISRVTLTWSAPAFHGGREITGYQVYRGSSESNSVLVATVSDVRSHIDSGLANGQAYHYAIRAVNSVGSGAPSVQVSAIPATVPNPPTLSSVIPSDRQVGLTWATPSFDGGRPLTGYSIYRSAGSYSEVLLADVGLTQTYTDTGLYNGLAYTYRVAAKNNVGVGNASIQMQAMPMPLPALDQSFDASTGVPTDWAFTGLWRVGSNCMAGSSAPNALQFNKKTVAVCSYNNGAAAPTGQAVSPIVNLSNHVNPQLTFMTQYKLDPNNPSGPTTISVQAKLGAAWTTVWSRTSASPAQDTWAPMTVDLTPYKAMTQIRFNFVGQAGANAANGWAVDDVRLVSTPARLPGNPQGLVAFPGSGEVILSWFSPSSDGGLPLTGYNVYRGTASGNEALVTSGGCSNIVALGCTDRGLTNGQVYYYQVRAAGPVGLSLPSNQVVTQPNSGPVLQEAFDTTSSLPSGWTATGLWRVGTDCLASASSPNSLQFNQVTGTTCNYQGAGRTTGSAISVSFDTSGRLKPILTFATKHQLGATALDKDVLTVQAKTATGAWTTVWTRTSGDQTSWATVTVDLTPFKSTGTQVRFTFDSVDGVDNLNPGWGVDNFLVN